MPFVPENVAQDPSKSLEQNPKVEYSAKLLTELNNTMKEVSNYLDLKDSEARPAVPLAKPRNLSSAQLPELTEDEIIRIVEESKTDPATRPNIYDALFE